MALAARCGAEGKGGRLWQLRCACGNLFTAKTTSINSTKQKTRCFECSRKAMSEANRGRNATHGESNTYLHTAWCGMRRRCSDTKHRAYKNYGGRGISVCEEWRDDYLAFATYTRENLGDRPSPKHSIDRIDNDGDYRPGNIRWATPAEQAANRRNSSRRDLPAPSSDGSISRAVPDGLLLGWTEQEWVLRLKKQSSKTIHEAAVTFGISPSTLRAVAAAHGIKFAKAPSSARQTRSVQDLSAIPKAHEAERLDQSI